MGTSAEKNRMSMSNLIKIFPGLAQNYCEISSPEESHYNCIAWAAGDDQNWWWPDPYGQYYWPAGVPRYESISAFIEAFKTLGYVECQDGIYEEVYTKIAIFVDDNDKPTHAARQLINGNWTSKCGELEDIEHDLNALCGRCYGKVVLYMKKPA